MSPSSTEEKSNTLSVLAQKLKAKIPFFANFTNQEIFELLQLSVRKQYKAKDIIFLENEAGKEMYVILSGDVKIYKTTNNEKQILLASLSSNDCFGEMSLIDGSKRSAKAIAVSDVILLALQEDVLKTNSHLSYKLFKNFSFLMAQRLRLANKNYSDASAEETKNRNKFSLILKSYTDKGGSFEGANFRSSKLDGVVFSKSQMKSSLFVGANLKDGRINNSRFELASFVGASFQNAMFNDCDFKNSNFSAVFFEKVIFKNCNFDVSTLQQLEARGIKILK